MKSLLRSFFHAFEGLKSAFIGERNLKIHSFFAVAVIAISIYYQLSIIEWCIIIIAIGGMFTAELINTAVERTVDLSTTEVHPLAKQAKDIAAGACFVWSFVSVILGLLIFLPKIV